jgi:hypothetical protein
LNPHANKIFVTDPETCRIGSHEEFKIPKVPRLSPTRSRTSSTYTSSTQNYEDSSHRSRRDYSLKSNEHSFDKKSDYQYHQKPTPKPRSHSRDKKSTLTKKREHSH